ncbi:hypothetical protein TNCV_3357531 [Trichonephila clavipes]|nr:hypothetical protein TNCV_3357531 [Trichonephila clavipes]
MSEPKQFVGETRRPALQILSLLLCANKRHRRLRTSQHCPSQQRRGLTVLNDLNVFLQGPPTLASLSLEEDSCKDVTTPSDAFPLWHD